MKVDEITERCAECEIQAGYASRWDSCEACGVRFCAECFADALCPDTADGHHTTEPVDDEAVYTTVAPRVRELVNPTKGEA